MCGNCRGWPESMIAQLSRFCQFAELKGRDQPHLRMGTVQSAMVLVFSGEIKLLSARGLATQTGSVKKGEWLSEAAILQVQLPQLNILHNSTSSVSEFLCAFIATSPAGTACDNRQLGQSPSWSFCIRNSLSSSEYTQQQRSTTECMCVYLISSV